MSSWNILTKEKFRRSTWKNGLGHTDEIAIYPANATLQKGDFLWRLSSAQIERASPFSTFPNHDRVLVILKGAGIKLTHTFVEGEPEEAVDLPRLEPYEFPGDVPSRCELTGGAVTDFSIFVRKAEVEPFVEVIRMTEGEDYDWQPTGRWNFIFAVKNSVDLESLSLVEGDAATLSVSDVDSVSTVNLRSKADQTILLGVSLS